MKWAQPASGEVSWLCPGWEVPAGFCTALQTPWEAEAYGRLAALAGLGKTAWAFLQQVHGVALQKAEGLKKGEIRCLGEADGLWTEQAGVALAVQTADCVPILMRDKRRRRVAAVHAGWRGVLGRIVLAQLQVFLEAGSRPKDIQVALGPSIGPCCYEVSEELAQRFSAKWGRAVVFKLEGASKPSLDLAEALALDLCSAGIPTEQLQTARVCTFCDKRFHSYRREQGKAGRQLSWVQLSG